MPSHYLTQCWVIVNWTLRNKLKWNYNQNTKFFIHENAFQDTVCEMAAILSRKRWLDALHGALMAVLVISLIKHFNTLSVKWVIFSLKPAQQKHNYLRNCSMKIPTRQIWGIWKLRPAYSPETPNLGQNRWCFVLCDLEIWRMTLKNKREPLQCYFKLCASFRSHWCIQTWVRVRKRPIWVKFHDF